MWEGDDVGSKELNHVQWFAGNEASQLQANVGLVQARVLSMKVNVPLKGNEEGGRGEERQREAERGERGRRGRRKGVMRRGRE